MKTVIFVSFTSYQLLNAVYYARKISATGNKCRRVLIWQDYSNYTIDIHRFDDVFDEFWIIDDFYKKSSAKRQFDKCLYGGWLFRFSNIYRKLSHIDVSNSVLVIFSDQHILSRKILNRFGDEFKDVILVEEGMATYLVKPGKLSGKSAFVNNVLLGAKQELYIGANSHIRTMFVRHPEMLPNLKVLNRSIIRQNNVFRDGSLNSFFEDVLYGSIVAETNGKKVMLWLGQPLEEDCVDAGAQVEWIRNVAENIPHEYCILIKMHPREKTEKYMGLTEQYPNVKLLQLNEFNWIPVELLASLIHPEVVLSAYSSAANNILELGIRCKVIYFYPVFKMKLSENVTDILCTSKNVYCIKNKGEFLRALQSAIDEQAEGEFENMNEDARYLMAHIF